VASAVAAKRSPTSKMTPLIVRKIAAARGLAKSTRSLCSNKSPAMPTGTVATASTNSSR
jgi:hypothetical protein